ncbi:MAG: MFS transporter [Clostridia bacterium]|nr:MFS transporter [Clostridia bacterium]
MQESSAITKEPTALKLNMKRTFTIGFAFFGILLLWQVYDSWCPVFLTELFGNAIFGNAASAHAEEVQYLVGIIMALDNLAALILLPIFGMLSDKTHTKIGKRMPYILIGTFVSAVAFPFIPVLFHYHNVAGTVVVMAIVVCFMMMYRNPAVALMPDLTPKPLRSKANGIINIMGYIGGFFATIVGIVFVLSQYLGSQEGAEHTWQYQNIWAIEAPFLIASVLMVVSAVFLFVKIKENAVAEEIKDEMALGEKLAEVVDKVDDGAMSKGNRIMLIMILVAEFFWFMSDNGISTFMGNYTVYYLGAATSSNMINTIMGGVGSVAGFALGGIVAEKIGRKWTVVSGLALAALSNLVWMILSFTVLEGAAGSGSFPVAIYVIWFVKGLGMSLVHINSFPMVVELCSSSKIGRFTGYYYASSMAAQTATPILLGLLLLSPEFSFNLLPLYAFSCLMVSVIVFILIKNVKVNKVKINKGLEAFDSED